MRAAKFEEKILSIAVPNQGATRSPETEIFVAYGTLRQHGIVYTRVHLRRLISRGLFPTPVYLSPNRIAWRLSDLAIWKATRPVVCEAA